jgi:hypothetical protein
MYSSGVFGGVRTNGGVCTAKLQTFFAYCIGSDEEGRDSILQYFQLLLNYPISFPGLDDWSLEYGGMFRSFSNVLRYGISNLERSSTYEDSSGKVWLCCPKLSSSFWASLMTVLWHALELLLGEKLARRM